MGTHGRARAPGGAGDTSGNLHRPPPRHGMSARPALRGTPKAGREVPGKRPRWPRGGGWGGRLPRWTPRLPGTAPWPAGLGQEPAKANSGYRAGAQTGRQSGASSGPAGPPIKGWCICERPEDRQQQSPPQTSACGRGGGRTSWLPHAQGSEGGGDSFYSKQTNKLFCSKKPKREKEKETKEENMFLPLLEQ